MARKMAAGELQTTWFERHNSTPITELPADWPDDYRKLVERRIGLIETDPNIRLIEQPEFKRRWNTESWESQVERALRGWLLDRLESYFDFDGRMNDDARPTAKLPIACSRSASSPTSPGRTRSFTKSASFMDDPAFDVTKLVAELVEAESVPLCRSSATSPPASPSGSSGKTPGTSSARKTPSTPARPFPTNIPTS